MFLLCGGEGAAGLKTGGVFFLLVSYAGPDGRGGHRGVENAARRHLRWAPAPRSGFRVGARPMDRRAALRSI